MVNPPNVSMWLNISTIATKSVTVSSIELNSISTNDAG